MDDNQLFRLQNLVFVSTHNNNGHMVIGSIYFRAFENNHIVRGRIRLCHDFGPVVENNNFTSWNLRQFDPIALAFLPNTINMRNVPLANVANYNYEILNVNQGNLLQIPIQLGHLSRGRFTTQFNNNFTQVLINNLVDAIRNGADNIVVSGIMRNQTNVWGWQWHTGQGNGL